VAISMKSEFRAEDLKTNSHLDSRERNKSCSLKQDLPRLILRRSQEDTGNRGKRREVGGNQRQGRGIPYVFKCQG